jgi:arylsulfatase A-like enzyme
VASHFGGTRQGLAISWPGHIDDPGGIRPQFHHIVDIVPTILEATGIKASQFVDGIKQRLIEGVSMAYTFKKANANAPTTHHTQYFEMIANRGIHPPVSPWVLDAPMPAVKDYNWELYNLIDDYSQNHDLSAKMPDQLKEMQALFAQEAAKYQVFRWTTADSARDHAPPKPDRRQDRAHVFGRRIGH